MLTSGVGQFILLSLDPILQVLSLASRLLDARLHGLGRHIVRPLRVHGAGGCVSGREKTKEAARELKGR